MKVLVVSDNHRDESSLEELIYLYEDQIDLWLHCGDSELSSTHPIWKTFQTVNGNMDRRNEFSEQIIETMGDETFVVVHGHRHQVRYSFEPMEELAKEQDARIVFYGHTHIAKVDQRDNIYFINPGSITQPRGPLSTGSYAIYEKNGNDEYITFYDWNHNKIKDLSQSLS